MIRLFSRIKKYLLLNFVHTIISESYSVPETSLSINANKSETSLKSIQKTGLKWYSPFNYHIKWKPLFRKSKKNVVELCLLGNYE